MRIIPEVPNFTRWGDNIVNIWWEMFQCVYAQVVSDNNGEKWLRLPKRTYSKGIISWTVENSA